MLYVFAFFSLAVTCRPAHLRLRPAAVSVVRVRLCSTETVAPWGDVPLDVQQRMHAAGYVRPLPIQRAALAPIANGSNVVLHAATGSGKTLAYLVPILAKISPASSGLQAIIVSPSQELAIQIAAEAQRLLASEQVCAGHNLHVLFPLSHPVSPLS
jgi:superfamily II DNA/RNA helicase